MNGSSKTVCNFYSAQRALAQSRWDFFQCRESEKSSCKSPRSHRYLVWLVTLLLALGGWPANLQIPTVSSKLQSGDLIGVSNLNKTASFSSILLECLFIRRTEQKGLRMVSAGAIVDGRLVELSDLRVIERLRWNHVGDRGNIFELKSLEVLNTLGDSEFDFVITEGKTVKVLDSCEPTFPSAVRYHQRFGCSCLAVYTRQLFN